MLSIPHKFYVYIILFSSFFFYLYSFVLQIFPGAITQQLMWDLQINATQLGYLSAFYYLSYTPLQLLAGILLDRYEAVTILTGMWLVAACGSWLFSQSSNFYVVTFARFILGIASAGAFITALHLGARWLSAERFTVFAGGVGWLGALAGILGTTPLLRWLNYSSWSNIMKVFSFIGLGGVVVGLLCGKRLIGPLSHKETSLKRYSLFKNRTLWLLGTYSFLVWGPILVFSLWGNLFLQLKYLCSPIEAASCLSQMWWGMAFFSLVLGYLAKRVVVAKLMFGTSLLGLGGVFWLILGSCPVYLLKGVIFCVGGAAAGQILAFIQIKQTVTPEELGLSNGFNNMWVVLGGLILPILVGYTLDCSSEGNLMRNYQLLDFTRGLIWLIWCYLGATITSCFLCLEHN